MPRAKPDKSFEVAVRHLFRHLGEASRLCDNPIAQFAFKPTTEGRRQRGDVALSIIKANILDACRQCGAEDVEVGRPLDARRDRVIIAGLCAMVSASQIAAKLGLGPRQFYRYRHAICR